MVQKYKSVSVPSGLVEDVEKVVGSCGYVSVTEFVKDACRRRLEEVAIEFHEQQARVLYAVKRGGGSE